MEWLRINEVGEEQLALGVGCWLEVRREKSGGENVPDLETDVAIGAPPMLSTHLEPAMGQPDDFVQIKSYIVLAAPRVFDRCLPDQREWGTALLLMPPATPNANWVTSPERDDAVLRQPRSRE